MGYRAIIDKKEVPIQVTRKNMKSVRLKVFPTGEIHLSVPLDTPDAWIADFIEQKQKWIADKINLFSQTKSIEKEIHIRSGSSTRILGKQLIIQVETASQKSIQKSDKKLIIYTLDTDDTLSVDKQFNNWWQKDAKKHFVEIVDKLYPIIQKHGIDKPEIIVKKMSTLWGSCSRKHGRINLNFYLYRAPFPCIEYVVLHEIAHFIYPKHNKEFYDFLTIHMPDWQERKRVLDYEIVLGI